MRREKRGREGFGEKVESDGMEYGKKGKRG